MANVIKKILWAEIQFWFMITFTWHGNDFTWLSRMKTCCAEKVLILLKSEAENCLAKCRMMSSGMFPFIRRRCRWRRDPCQWGMCSSFVSLLYGNQTALTCSVTATGAGSYFTNLPMRAQTSVIIYASLSPLLPYWGAFHIPWHTVP